MRRVTSTYTPSNMDRGLLRRILVERDRLLDLLVERLARSMTSSDRHHILVVGPRGSGKTHLVTLVEHELAGREELGDQMRIAWLGEDETISSLVDLAFAIAGELARRYPSEFQREFRESVRGMRPDAAAASVFLAVVERLKHRNLLLIMENMDRAFDGLGDLGRKKWRAFLQEQGRVATLATAQQLFSAVSSRDEAFFGFFDVHHLRPLTVDGARELIRKIGVEQGKGDLEKYLDTPEGRYRIRALHHLAGGNQRLYVMLSEFLTKEALDDLVAAFERLAEDLTPYFQERIRALPPQQARIVECLCSATGAMTVKEIAEDTFIDERTCAKQLGNLRARSYVRSHRRGKESFYEVTEPLLRLCLDVKNQRGRPLKLVAQFLRAWFSDEQLRRPDAGALFALPEPMVMTSSREAVIEALRTALRDGDPSASDFAGTPHDLLATVLRRGPNEWPAYVTDLAPLYIEHGAADKLGQGLIRTIAALDAGAYSAAQLDTWNSAWQEAGANCEGLSLPLLGLAAATEAIKTKSDRPLLRLPAEIRTLIRPLLTVTLGPIADEP